MKPSVNEIIDEFKHDNIFGFTKTEIASIVKRTSKGTINIAEFLTLPHAVQYLLTWLDREIVDKPYCECCKREVENREKLFSIAGGDYFIDERNLIVFNSDDNLVITYCPICGRKLGD